MNGSLFKKAIISGTNNLINHKKEVDELNVFPVPDGDTGTNMSLTAAAGARALEMLQNGNPTVSEVADTVASAFLRGARGNSGVIMSILFRGIAHSLKGKKEMTGADFAEALSEGVSSAYKAVMKPTEGTILTVARISAEKAKEASAKTNDIVQIMRVIFDEAGKTLEKTPDLLPVLKKAGVVDAGGKGLLIIYQGMLSVISENKLIEVKNADKNENIAVRHNPVAESNEVIKFEYCTEYIINRTGKKKSPLALRAYLETIGDCVVVVDDEEIIKVHVHTNAPGNAVQEGLKYGYLDSIKIDNMRFQHDNKVHEAKQMQNEETYVPVDADIAYGFVAVASGAGIKSLFIDLGVSKVVGGGQTMNPSTEDILQAIHSVPAKNVFVLPNNKNIIMAAEQAVAMADRNVCVLQTRTIPQGISAMIAFDQCASFSDNRMAMTKVIDNVHTGHVTFAARDSEFDGKKIKEGEIIALENGRLVHSEKDINKTAYKLVRSMSKKHTQYISIIYGMDVQDEQAEELYEHVSEKFGEDVEVTLINGGQPVYYYIISVE